MFKRTSSSLIKAALVGVAMIALVSLAGGTAQAQTATVSGTVTDAATGLPIEGAFVTLRPADCTGGGGGGGCLPGMGHGWGHGGGGGMGGHHGSGGAGVAIRVQTDANGMYVIENLEANDYLMRACACGYVPTDLIPVTVADGETVVQDFTLNLR
jgi:hypothetical protein